MDGEPLKNASYKERINVFEVVNAQISSLVVDSYVDVHMLFTVIAD